MRLRNCKRCGKPYETDRPGTIFCPACSDSHHKSAPVRNRVCRQCGVTFPGGPRAWYCPSCRSDRRREADKQRKKTGTARPLGSTDICKRCGKEYIVNSGMQMYCNDCAEIAVKEKVRGHKREYYAENRDALNDHKREVRVDRKVCVICGAVFDADTPTVTCSPACAEKLKKLRQDEADIRRGRRKMPAGVSYDSGLPKSGIVGVTASRNGKWRATYKGKYLGIFPSIPDAAAAIEKYKGENKK